VPLCAWRSNSHDLRLVRGSSEEFDIFYQQNQSISAVVVRAEQHQKKPGALLVYRTSVNQNEVSPLHGVLSCFRSIVSGDSCSSGESVKRDGIFTIPAKLLGHARQGFNPYRQRHFSRARELACAAGEADIQNGTRNVRT
jgi:hypothetical protein